MNNKIPGRRVTVWLLTDPQNGMIFDNAELKLSGQTWIVEHVADSRERGRMELTFFPSHAVLKAKVE